MLGVLAVLAFIIADVATLVFLGRTFGGWWLLGALLLGLVACGVTFRYLGPVTAFRVAGRLGRGEMPGRELVDALLMAVAALLFAFPGLLSDALALILVLPGLRAIPRGLVIRWARKRAVVVGAPPAPAPNTTGGAIDVDFERR